MNDLSLLGKNWVQKNYDPTYVKFIKENYSLDEIVAKLLAIRNIDKTIILSDFRFLKSLYKRKK